MKETEPLEFDMSNEDIELAIKKLQDFNKELTNTIVKPIEETIAAPVKAVHKQTSKPIAASTVMLSIDFKDKLKQLKGSLSYEEYLKQKLNL